MANLSDFQPWLNAYHLGGLGVPRVVTVQAFEAIPAYNKRARKIEPIPCLRLREYPQPLALSPRRLSELQALLGNDSAKFAGRKITLTARAVEVAGKHHNPIYISEAK